MDPRRHQHQLCNFIKPKTKCQGLNGDPWGNRTPVSGVRGLRLNRLTNGPYGYRLHPENRTKRRGRAKLLSSLPALFRSSPRVISTSQLNMLPCVHLWPIYDVVYIDPYSIMDGRTYLRESFTLRCFQRLSRPYIATQLCRWHDNWCTRGMSIPVLSY